MAWGLEAGGAHRWGTSILLDTRVAARAESDLAAGREHCRVAFVFVVRTLRIFDALRVYKVSRPRGDRQ